MFVFPHYMGTTTGDVAVFLNNFALKLPQFASALGIDATQLSYVKDGAALYNWLENTYLVEIRDASKGATDARDMLAADAMPSPFVPSVAQFTPPPATSAPVDDGFIGYINNMVKGIRLTKAYQTDANIGATLKINAPAETSAPPAKASIKGVEGLPGFAVQVKANKYGAKSVLFYDMKDPSNPVLLGAQQSAIFEDDRPPSVPGQSEMRSYAIRYGDSQNKALPDSLLSDVVSLPTHP